jgi:alpha-tubulin suppressor-like RCC1 family protein
MRALGGTGPDTLDPRVVSGLPTDLVVLSTGMYHNCVLSQAGRVWCWGRNYNGECGEPPAVPDYTEVPNDVGLSDVSALSAGYMHNCAVHGTSAKSVSCWGYGLYGQLGNNDAQSSHVPVPVFDSYGGNPISVTSGRFFSCLLKGDGTVWCWGDGVGVDSTTPIQVSGLSGVTGITAGYSHACALKNDDTVWCWGSNTWGRLGDGTLVDATTPVQVANLNNVAVLEAGASHTCAVDDGGALYCWGDNAYGQLGNGLSDLHPVPALITEP